MSSSVSFSRMISAMRNCSAAVGELLRREQRRRLRQVPRDHLLAGARGCRPSSAPTPARSRAKSCRSASSARNGSSRSRGCTRVDLVDHRDDRPAGLARRAAAPGRPRRRSAAPRPRTRTRSASCQRAAAARFIARFSARPAALVQARRVDEGDLRVRQVHQPEHAMARGLRPRRDDGELLPDQRVQQRGLADVGPADQRGEAAAMLAATAGPAGRQCVAHLPCCRIACSTAAPLPARRGGGWTRALRLRRPASAGAPRSAPEGLLMRLARRRFRARTRQRHRPRPCSSSCSRVLASFRSPSAAGAAACAHHSRSDQAARRRRGRHPGRRRRTAPRVASARMDSRRKPPVLQLAAAQPQHLADAELLRRSRPAAPR